MGGNKQNNEDQAQAQADMIRSSWRMPNNPVTFIMAFGPFAFGVAAVYFLWVNIMAPQLQQMGSERDKIYDAGKAAAAAAQAAVSAAEAAKRTSEANQATATVLQHVTEQLMRVSEKIGYVEGREGRSK